MRSGGPKRLWGAESVKTTESAERLYRARPRAIGLDWTPGCFCCGGERGLHYNISFFVPSRETGEVVASLFASGAFLDYRDFEPNWIQVKVGACDDHLPNLEHLVEMVWQTRGKTDGPGISGRMVEEATSGNH
jgi:hypothetical protein